MDHRPEYADIVFDLLQIGERVPLTVREMASSLQVTFFPPHERTPRLDRFTLQMRETLRAIGVTVLEFDDALCDDGQKVRPGIVIFEQGEGRDGEFAVHRIPGLYQNPLVAIYDAPPPFGPDADLQQTLDAIVGVMAWNQTQVPIFVEDDRWTICTMNGAVIDCGSWGDMREDVLQSLVPKLTAQVVPPRQADITYREGALDVEAEGLLGHVEDFMAAARVWRNNGLMLAHTSVDSLRYRSRFYRRLVSAYLDKRTGMSYGFMARQLPTDVRPASLSAGGNGTGADDAVTMHFLDREWQVPRPDVWILGTRSGCEKTNLNPERDIVRLGLVDGRIVFDTPRGVSASQCRPSYDTMAILAHGAGNVIAASLLAARDQEDPFARALATDGLSLSHWHGYPADDDLPPGYVVHGRANPPVSCSTPQSAVYALVGKLEALERVLRDGRAYEGDLHIEPHHGSNMTGNLSLEATALWVDRQLARVEA